MPGNKYHSAKEQQSQVSQSCGYYHKTTGKVLGTGNNDLEALSGYELCCEGRVYAQVRLCLKCTGKPKMWEEPDICWIPGSTLRPVQRMTQSMDFVL